MLPIRKNFIACFAILLILFGSFVSYSYGSVPSSISVYLDSQKLAFDVAPTILNGRLMVPLRIIAEEFYSNIQWIPQTKKVIVKNGPNTISLQVGSDDVTMNDSVMKIDVAPILINGRVLVPLRFIAESFDSTVNWDDSTKTVDIFSKELDLPGKDLIQKYAEIDEDYYQNVVKKMEDFKVLKEWKNNLLMQSTGDYQSVVEKLAGTPPFGDYFCLKIDRPTNQDLAWCSLYLSETLNFENYFTMDLTQKIFDLEEDLILNKNLFESTAGDPDWNKIRYVKIAFESKPGKSFIISPLSFSTYNADALCTLWFDDGWEDSYTNAFQIINSINKNIPAEVSIIPKNIGQAKYMNETQLTELLHAGWGLCNHTFSHQYLGQIPIQEAKKEIEYGINHLFPIMGNEALTIALPYSSVNSDVLSIVKNTSVFCRYVPDRVNLIPTNRFTIAYKEVTSTTDFETIASWIDESVRSKYWLVLLFHKVEDVETAGTIVSSETFKKIVEYLNSNKNDITTVTASQALSSMGYSED